MADTANNGAQSAPHVPATVAPVLVWDRKKAWGTTGFTHYTSATVGENSYRFVIDKPRGPGGVWTARGWVNGSMCMYRDNKDATSLTAMKDIVAAYVAELRRKAAEK